MDILDGQIRYVREVCGIDGFQLVQGEITWNAATLTAGNYALMTKNYALTAKKYALTKYIATCEKGEEILINFVQKAAILSCQWWNCMIIERRDMLRSLNINYLTNSKR